MDIIKSFQITSDYHQSVNYARLMTMIGWEVVPLRGSYLFLRRVGPISFAKWQRPATVDRPQIAKIAKQLNIVKLYLEPALVTTLETGETTSDLGALLLPFGFRETTTHHAYTKTLVIDLRPDIDAVMKGFSQTSRLQIKRSQRLGVTYKKILFSQLDAGVIQQILKLHAMWRQEKQVLGYDDHFLRSLFKAFDYQGEAILAFVEEKLHGVLLLTYHAGVGQYFYQFTSKEGRDKLYLPSGLAYQGMRSAKTRGSVWFDFCSCYDERYKSENLKWRGFSEHKARFHPTPIYYPPAFVLTRLPYLC